jgi:hypothetical protein
VSTEVGRSASRSLTAYSRYKASPNKSRLFTSLNAANRSLSKYIHSLKQASTCSESVDELSLADRTSALVSDGVALLWPLALPGVIFSLPAGYHIDAGSLAAASTVTFTNFNAKYSHGGLPPPGGGIISLAKDVMPPGDLYGALASSYPGAQADTLTVAGASAVRLIYSSNVGPDTALKVIAVFIPAGGSLVRASVTYADGDSDAAGIENSFAQFIASIGIQ